MRKLFGTITGHNLRQVKIKIAEFCRGLEEKNGDVNINNVVYNIVEQYKLDCNWEDLVHDVYLFYIAIRDERVKEISRAGYYQFRIIDTAEQLVEFLDNLLPTPTPPRKPL